MASRIPQAGAGVYVGTVTRVDAAGGVYVDVPRLTAGLEYGPCVALAAGGPYTPGARVLVAALEGRRDDVAVLGATV